METGGFPFIEPARVLPERAGMAPESSGTAAQPSRTAPEVSATTPEPSATTPEPSGMVPEPSGTFKKVIFGLFSRLNGSSGQKWPPPSPVSGEPVFRPRIRRVRVTAHFPEPEDVAVEEHDFAD